MNDKQPEQFFLDCDNDGHWYVVPVKLRAEWEKWNNTPYNESEPEEPPHGVQSVGGSPALVTFTHPIIT